jgi:hypothetical protein
MGNTTALFSAPLLFSKCGWQGNSQFSHAMCRIQIRIFISWNLVLHGLINLIYSFHLVKVKSRKILFKRNAAILHLEKGNWSTVTHALSKTIHAIRFIIIFGIYTEKIIYSTYIYITNVGMRMICDKTKFSIMMLFMSKTPYIHTPNWIFMNCN